MNAVLIIIQIPCFVIDRSCDTQVGPCSRCYSGSGVCSVDAAATATAADCVVWVQGGLG